MSSKQVSGNGSNSADVMIESIIEEMTTEASAKLAQYVEAMEHRMQQQIDRLSKELAELRK